MIQHSEDPLLTCCPAENECEDPELPDIPDPSSELKPKFRFNSKTTPQPENMEMNFINGVLLHNSNMHLK